MEFRHTVDPNSDQPIMLLDDEIGYDPETGRGIPADQFCRELLFLDTLGKSKINIWINSHGGSVVDGMQIFNTILKTKTRIDTHNVGMAASIAAPIFLAGRNRYMMDNTVLMVHPVSGGDEESRKVFEGCVNTMISTRSFLNTQTVQAMMNATTWLDAYECENLGLCIKESSQDFNKQRAKPDLSNVSEAHKAYRTLVNSAIEKFKPNKMSYKNITNKLELVEDASENSIVNAIDNLKNKVSTSETLVNNLKKEINDKDKAYGDLENKYKDLENKVKEAEKAAEAAKVEALNKEAESFVNDNVKNGKIANKAEVINTWVNNYKANPEGTKAMIEAIPMNKKGVILPKEAGKGGASDEKLTMVAADSMAELRNKFKI